MSTQPGTNAGCIINADELGKYFKLGCFFVDIFGRYRLKYFPKSYVQYKKIRFYT